MKYHPDIDGLRAIAALCMVVFHAFPSHFPGGFIGVDIFFVISGYLITVLIFQDLYNGTFNFSKFYAQRIRRIFPALILILVFCLGFGWLALLPDEFKQLGNHISASAVFINNIALLRETGNFDNTAETKPLLHLWSLSIDNQRYREKRRYYLGSTCR